MATNKWSTVKSRQHKHTMGSVDKSNKSLLIVIIIPDSVVAALLAVIVVISSN